MPGKGTKTQRRAKKPDAPPEDIGIGDWYEKHHGDPLTPLELDATRMLTMPNLRPRIKWKLPFGDFVVDSYREVRIAQTMRPDWF